jgi:hypothetical protein
LIFVTIAATDEKTTLLILLISVIRYTLDGFVLVAALSKRKSSFFEERQKHTGDFTFSPSLIPPLLL